MKEKLQALARQMDAKRKQAEALLVKDDVTAEEIAEAGKLIEDAESIQNQMHLMEKSTNIGNWLSQSATPQTAQTALQSHDVTPPPLTFGAGVHTERKSRIKPYSTNVKHFKTDDNGIAHEKAYRFGRWFLGVCGDENSQQYCFDEGICSAKSDFSGRSFKAGQRENDNTAGGSLVPIEFRAELISLIENYGVFRKWADNWPMTRDTLLVPRRTGGLTVYYPGEGGSITPSTASFDNVELRAQKFATLTTTSMELVEDAAIDIGDRIAFEMAWAFAKAEDNNGFLGDGTSTYGGYVGVKNRFGVTAATYAGITTGTGTGWSGLVLTDFEGVVGKLPAFADSDNCAWFCHRTFYHTIMVKLMLAAGGTQAYEIYNGLRRPMFLGYPVVWTQAMPSSSASADLPCHFGDLSLAAAFGDRRQIAIATSEHANFSTDELAIRGTQRVDINVHDIGNSSVAGPLVTLLTG